MVVPMEIFRVSEIPVLIAIPLFTFAGYLLGESQAPQRLVRVTNVLFGWMPGGLAVVALFVCALFTAFTGASGVTIIAMGALLYPAIAAAGYREQFNLGLITTSGSLGLLFAPSLPLILYGIIAEQSVDELFVAGILPGLLMLFLLSLYGAFAKAAFVRVRRQTGTDSIVARLVAALPRVDLGDPAAGDRSRRGLQRVLCGLRGGSRDRRLCLHRRGPHLPRHSSSPGAEIMRDSMILVGGILIILGRFAGVDKLHDRRAGADEALRVGHRPRLLQAQLPDPPQSLPPRCSG